MLSFLGTAAGTIGTTIVVALMEMEGGTRLWTHAAVFTDAQQFACIVGAGGGLNYRPRGIVSQR